MSPIERLRVDTSRLHERYRQNVDRAKQNVPAGAARTKDDDLLSLYTRRESADAKQVVLAASKRILDQATPGVAVKSVTTSAAPASGVLKTTSEPVATKGASDDTNNLIVKISDKAGRSSVSVPTPSDEVIDREDDAVDNDDAADDETAGEDTVDGNTVDDHTVDDEAASDEVTDGEVIETDDGGTDINDPEPISDPESEEAASDEVADDGGSTDNNVDDPINGSGETVDSDGEPAEQITEGEVIAQDGVEPPQIQEASAEGGDDVSSGTVEEPSEPESTDVQQDPADAPVDESTDGGDNPYVDPGGASGELIDIVA